jgi:hypothetical protein
VSSVSDDNQGKLTAGPFLRYLASLYR